MGYDLLNEPWMGTEWPLCLTTGCPESVRDELQPAMEKGLATVRRLDAHNIVWWEPQQFAGGQPVDTFLTAPTNRPGEKELGYSWHNYCPDVFAATHGVPDNIENCKSWTNGREAHALAQAATMHAVPMMSEWGATDQPAGDRHRRGVGRPAPDGLDALGLQVLERPDHHRPVPGAGSPTTPTSRRSSRAS